MRERENARALDARAARRAVDLVTGDLSFISLRLVLPAVAASCAPGGDAVLLVKPQFEVGKGEVGKGGVVRDDAKRRAALDGVAEAARGLGFEVVGEAESPIEGPAGNREWLLALRKPAVTSAARAPGPPRQAAGHAPPLFLDPVRAVCYSHPPHFRARRRRVYESGPRSPTFSFFWGSCRHWPRSPSRSASGGSSSPSWPRRL